MCGIGRGFAEAMLELQGKKEKRDYALGVGAG
jgi:hypothetical protein